MITAVSQTSDASCTGARMFLSGEVEPFAFGTGVLDLRRGGASYEEVLDDVVVASLK